ncbi:MAG: uracil-DNA glycosylase family protein [Methylococcaceae bacterium]|nr:uracil-DNA glycosylase family protein [Methylococcaceae bacterium]MCI0666630.1 uracil-DNA glycosylase family protein [Methylococcaceae bacterium]MCI0733385.1 uracil-DNA glycosylase family protein [Methylococcaceae bacterium]
MIGPVVTGLPVASPVFLIGQAPGIKEGEFGKPFAWTAGKTMFHWFCEIGLNEEKFRQRVYMAAVCRCFPGKNPKGGDRVPSRAEVERCRTWMEYELNLLRPALIIPVGKLAVSQFMPVDKLNQVVGQIHRLTVQHFESDVIPLPHPSGASTWHRTEPGKTLLWRSLRLIEIHAAWKKICHGQANADVERTFNSR